jgi:hypothetical protein
MASDQVKKCYRIFHPEQEGTGQYSEPDWSKTPSLLELIRLAFGDGFIIGDKNHPEARRIRGAVK